MDDVIKKGSNSNLPPSSFQIKQKNTGDNNSTNDNYSHS